MQYAGKVFCALTHPHCYFPLVPVVRHLPVLHPFFSCKTEALRIPPAFHLSCHVQTWCYYWRVLECHLGASWHLLEERSGFRSYDRFCSCKIQEKKFLNLSVLLCSLSSFCFLSTITLSSCEKKAWNRTLTSAIPVQYSHQLSCQSQLGVRQSETRLCLNLNFVSMHCSRNYGTNPHTPYVYKQPLRLIKKEDHEVIPIDIRYLYFCVVQRKWSRVLHFDHTREGNGSWDSFQELS